MLSKKCWMKQLDNSPMALTTNLLDKIPLDHFKEINLDACLGKDIDQLVEIVEDMEMLGVLEDIRKSISFIKDCENKSEINCNCNEIITPIETEQSIGCKCNISGNLILGTAVDNQINNLEFQNNKKNNHIRDEEHISDMNKVDINKNTNIKIYKKNKKYKRKLRCQRKIYKRKSNKENKNTKDMTAPVLSPTAVKGHLKQDAKKRKLFSMDSYVDSLFSLDPETFGFL